ncbi:hypothetical protein [uncultured Thiodictyon sp.]|jgi:hypothetical protein|uniref:hypothetical protein n=1 Tax=uncultured Thiodictyon sp. TaxID=1846217 RepID=UPI0025FEF397|nr:hypothetical protein [uncultured Thiodictyon sp.]
MIDEYALIPDVFDPSAYSNPDRIEMCLPHLREALYREAVIRDLGNGHWSAYCLSRDQSGTARFHRLAAELLRKLASGNRLHPFRQMSATEPSDSEGWCREALQTHTESRLTGVIAAHRSKQQFSDDIVGSIERLTSCEWWQSRSCSILLDRKTDAYLDTLRTLLQCANSFIFIDPNLDPTSNNYSEFHRLLSPLARRKPPPRIELHRSFCLGDGKARTFPKEPEWRQRFRSLDDELQRLGLSAEVYFWQDFHARYLITDLIGLVAEAGFDATATPNDLTTWARLGRDDRNRIQGLYDPTNVGRLKYHFRIGIA